MSKAPVYVVNTGIISAIGLSSESNLDSLLHQKAGIGKSTHFHSHWSDEIPVGEVPLSNEALSGYLNLETTWPRTALLSGVAVKEVLSSQLPLFDGLRTGFLSANTVGGMDLSEAAYPLPQEKLSFQQAQPYRNHECGAITQLVADHFGLHYFKTTISTACSSSANSIMMATQMIRDGMLDCAIAGGADALCRFTLNGFNTLMILDREPCQPFDNNRRGLNLGEGAGYLLLVSEAVLDQYHLSPLAIVSGWANANDAYHQTASSPQGKGNALAMSGALAVAGLEPSAISYINLHGTGTANNDSSEAAAISQVFGDHVPAASSTKSYTGHTLGAAAGIEAVYSVMSINNKVIFPTLRWEQKMDEANFKPVASLQQGAELKHVLSNSFGFGGNCSSLIFSTPV